MVGRMNKHVDLMLRCFKEAPHKLIGQYDSKEKTVFRVVFSDTRKRYTEFHRVQVSFMKNGRRVEHYYWFRTVKNKPRELIIDALTRQFEIMEEIYSSFSNRSDGSLKLNCCRPVALQTEYNTVITKECSGMLFNKYLQTTIPLFSRDEIIRHFRNCGTWLRKFHEFYRYEPGDTAEYKQCLDNFLSKYNREPLESLRYMTLCHNDYSPRNIFVSDGSVEVIDFVGSAMGFPEEDLEFFRNYIQRARFNLLYSRSFKENLLGAFEQAYMNGLVDDNTCPARIIRVRSPEPM